MKIEQVKQKLNNDRLRGELSPNLKLAFRIAYHLERSHRRGRCRSNTHIRNLMFWVDLGCAFNDELAFAVDKAALTAIESQGLCNG